MSVDASMTPGPLADAQLGLFDLGEGIPTVTQPDDARGDAARVRYIGSKARIVDAILEVIGSPGAGEGFFVDAFAGTGVVGARASEFGWPIRLNDHLLSAVVTSAARLLGADGVSFSQFGGYRQAVAELNGVRPRPKDCGRCSLPVEVVLPAHGAPRDHAALERAFS